MSVPPINIAQAVANPQLSSESSISVNVGELRKLVALAGLAPQFTVDLRQPDDLADSAAEPLRMADVDAGGNAD